MKFIHHFELIVHLYSTFHQLQFGQGQVAEVEFIDFIFLCIWQLSLLCKEGNPVVRAHEVFVGLSPAAPSPVPIPGPLGGSEQGGKGRILQGQPPAPRTLGATLPYSGPGPVPFCPAHQDLSEFLFLALPRLLPIHLSGFLSGPKVADREKKKSVTLSEV